MESQKEHRLEMLAAAYSAEMKVLYLDPMSVSEAVGEKVVCWGRQKAVHLARRKGKLLENLVGYLAEKTASSLV